MPSSSQQPSYLPRIHGEAPTGVSFSQPPGSYLAQSLGEALAESWSSLPPGYSSSLPPSYPTTREPSPNDSQSTEATSRRGRWWRRISEGLAGLRGRCRRAVLRHRERGEERRAERRAEDARREAAERRRNARKAAEVMADRGRPSSGGGSRGTVTAADVREDQAARDALGRDTWRSAWLT